MSESDLLWAMRRLNIDIDLLRALSDTGKPLAERRAAHTALLKQSKSTFKRCALELHPDRTGGDPSKTEEFQRLAAFAEMVEGIPAPEPVRKRVVLSRTHTSIRFTTHSTVL